MKNLSTFEEFLNETNQPYKEFMLEWMVPGKESNTMISKDLKELIDYVIKKGIQKYTIKGRQHNAWDILIG